MGLSRQQATKDDDAIILTQLWDVPFWNFFLELGRTSNFVLSEHKRLVGPLGTPILEVLRQFILRVWHCMVYHSFRCYMRLIHGPGWWSGNSPDLKAGQDCHTWAAESSFWDWKGGSCLLFWHWPSAIRVWARDGHPIHVNGTLPQYGRRQTYELNVTTQGQVCQKLEKFIQRGYMQKGTVCSLHSFFTVPKGDSDVRVVFDGTCSSLNKAIWALSFNLPTIDSLLTSLEPGCWQSDMDVSNFTTLALIHCCSPTVV